MSFFDVVLNIHGKLGLPALTFKEIRIYKELLLLFHKAGPLDIFEYGSGYSTIYFSKFLRGRDIPFQLNSLDNHAEWHQRVQEMVRDNNLENEVHLHLRKFIPFWMKEGWDWKRTPECGRFAPKLKEEIEYVEFPHTLNRQFDLIVVDARFRRRCLEEAHRSLKPHGVVFLHDAQKKHYQEPIQHYRFSEFIDSGHYFPFERTAYKIWIGSMDNPIVHQLADKYK